MDMANVMSGLRCHWRSSSLKPWHINAISRLMNEPKGLKLGLVGSMGHSNCHKHNMLGPNGYSEVRIL